ncbi:MAG: hypothetical protein AAF799_37110 [Myxococcota bacterium]
MTRPLRMVCFWSVVTVACGPAVVVPSGGASTSDGSTTRGEPLPTTSADPPSRTSSSTSSTGAHSDGLDSGFATGNPSFIDDPDLGPGSGAECDIVVQDCPTGEKCTWGQGNPVCVPLADDPAAPGEPCTIDDTGPFGPVDDCEQGGLCWFIDQETGVGTCYSMCTASSSYPVCDDPETFCALSGEGPPLCLRWCDPLGSDCAEGQGCYPINDWWRCAPTIDDASQLGEPCEFINGCEAGLICLSIEVFVSCEGIGCCGEVCSLDDPSCTSTAPETMCAPWYEEGDAPLQLEDVGACVEVPLRR